MLPALCFLHNFQPLYFVWYAMKPLFYILLWLFLLCATKNANCNTLATARYTDTLIVQQGVIGGKLSAKWRNTIAPRLTKTTFDSVSALQKNFTAGQQAWIHLIESRRNRWNLYRDSLQAAFEGCHVPDTIYVLVGMSEGNDAFTYQNNTICFDAEALEKLYGPAHLAENSERINRLFAHEFTHLVHKEWARKNKLQLKTFRDSVLWECLYEGLGMYRSLSANWLPLNGALPGITKNALAELSPQFVAMLSLVNGEGSLAEADKKRITANLSNGPVAKKWGAFTVAIWLALEANGHDRNLIYYTAKGPEAIILMAKKYLDGKSKHTFEKIF